MKEFFKPTILKIVITIILFVLSFIIQVGLWDIMDYQAYGFPLHFLESWGLTIGGGTGDSFNWLYFVIDIVFWYGISCILISGIKKLKK